MWDEVPAGTGGAATPKAGPSSSVPRFGGSPMRESFSANRGKVQTWHAPSRLNTDELQSPPTPMLAKTAPFQQRSQMALSGRFDLSATGQYAFSPTRREGGDANLSGVLARCGPYASKSRDGLSGGTVDFDRRNGGQSPDRGATGKLGETLQSTWKNAATVTFDNGLGETVATLPGTWKNPALTRSFRDDQPAFQKSFETIRLGAAFLLRAWWFDVFTGFVIIMNALTIGIAQSLTLQGQDTSVVDAFEHVFLIIYIFDLSLWFLAYGWHCLRFNWVKVDLFFVLLGITTTWIVEPLEETLGTQRGLKPLMVLRMFRLLRLARAIRLVYKFKQLWLIVQGLMTSMGTMAYVLLLVAVILYVFACLGIEVITNNSMREHDDEFEHIVETNFPSLPVTMLTLIQFTNMDMTPHIYKPLIEKDPWLVLYFVTMILVVAVVLMNLVTAVIVEGALAETSSQNEARTEEEKQKRAALIVKLEFLCKTLDSDGSGSVSRAELEAAAKADEDTEENSAFLELCSLLHAADMEDLVAKLDLAADDNVEIHALCDGLYKMIMFDVPVQLLRVEKDCAKMKNKMQEIESKLDAIYELLKSEAEAGSLSGIVGAAPRIKVVATDGVVGEGEACSAEHQTEVPNLRTSASSAKRADSRGGRRSKQGKKQAKIAVQSRTKSDPSSRSDLPPAPAPEPGPASPGGAEPPPEEAVGPAADAAPAPAGRDSVVTDVGGEMQVTRTDSDTLQRDILQASLVDALAGQATGEDGAAPRRATLLRTASDGELMSTSRSDTMMQQKDLLEAELVGAGGPSRAPASSSSSSNKASAPLAMNSAPTRGGASSAPARRSRALSLGRFVRRSQVLDKE